ncbi:MAG: UDP-N-acetylmuramoyl-L-alanyl-D-glutamate--2,6-diaminopimelate ligase [Oscillospiraceae bacterium]|nr:UDP-N-acetylmuramoyl-L-alanyl-D-glutamate--2,6-diaminopimelate ligase [Oscillospiraceae bacterium]
MKLSEIIRDLEILSATADMDMEICGVSYDSRRTEAGDLFVAVKGFSSDGHRFIPIAMAKGAAAVLCEDVPEDGTPYVQVADCRLGLAIASRNLFDNPAGEMTVIGITGTSGKTTSSYLIKHLLESRLGAKVGLIGTNGHMIGDEFLPSAFTTPESYELQKLFRRMADAGCTHVVMEVSSHSLALERVAGVHFDVALYTNLSQDHLDFHHTMEEYAAAKKKIFSMCSSACVNADDEWADYMTGEADCPILRFAADCEDADLRAERIALSAGGVCFTACFAEESAETSLAIPGMFSVHNALGVMAVGLVLGLSLEDCASALRDARGVKGRLESVPTDGDYAVIIDYSHKPDALENALRTLRPVTRGRLIVLFGCGGDRDRLKRPIMGRIAADNADLCIVTSDNPRTEEPESIIDEIMEGFRGKDTPVLRICDRIEAIRAALDNARAGDVILLAGKGHEDYQIVGHEKHHMDEREIVAEYLRMRKDR